MCTCHVQPDSKSNISCVPTSTWTQQSGLEFSGNFWRIFLSNETAYISDALLTKQSIPTNCHFGTFVHIAFCLVGRRQGSLPLRASPSRDWNRNPLLKCTMVLSLIPWYSLNHGNVPMVLALKHDGTPMMLPLVPKYYHGSASFIPWYRCGSMDIPWFWHAFYILPWQCNIMIHGTKNDHIVPFLLIVCYHGTIAV
jgi:hypothetical protein